jgi:hypothetical protein
MNFRNEIGQSCSRFAVRSATGVCLQNASGASQRDAATAGMNMSTE